MTDLSTAPRARLFTAFGTVMYVDPFTGELRHGPVEGSPANAFFEQGNSSEGMYRQGRLIYTVNGSSEPITCNTDTCFSVSHSQPESHAVDPTIFELIPLERGLLALKSGGLFWSAIPNGQMRLSAPVCSTWELFIASENWCTEITGLSGDLLRTAGPEFDKRGMHSYIIHPIIRARANRSSKRPRVLIYGYTKWSHGRVYYDIMCKLNDIGFIVDILDWQVNNVDHVEHLSKYYDLWMSALDGVSTLVDQYKIPYDRIIAISHHEFDIRMLIEQKGKEVFDKFANYGVVSESLYSASMMLGISRMPEVAPLGIDYQSFFSPLPERLTTVGYATSMSVETYGVEWKRGYLAEAAAQDAGLIFKVAGSTANQISFHDMPTFYRSVDAVVTSSVNESGPLSVMEGAAAGRLVIGTSVGHFPLKAYQGGGIIAPLEPSKFKAFTSATLRYYKDNPAAFAERCYATREAARKFDWQYSIDEWADLIERPGSAAKSARSAAQTYVDHGSISLTPVASRSNAEAGSSLIHLINLDRSITRLSKYQANNPHLVRNTLRVPAIDGASTDRSQLIKEGIITEDCAYLPGSLGCALSHINLWRLAVSENKVITIFEDDVRSSFDFLPESARILSNAPADWEMIKWGFLFDPLFLWLDFSFSKAKLEFYDRRYSKQGHLFQSDKSSRTLIKIAHSFGLQAYSVTPKGARKLLEKCLPLKKRTIPFPGTGVILEDTGIDCAMCAAYCSMQAFICMPPLVIADDEQPSDRVAADQKTGSSGS
ncbi:glycosyltransferase family 25 protein [Mesorhizobium sp. B2-1-8]|uniref:glycosyltransferase family 25 protein n=1 Tax=Mesorhizobium sp. B2-1-8 TaxID=2589967 RepID=UPI00112CB5E7|nr:glycosyltransferase family 25 protein [Mesorhizobium sp. B2-1-8]UCI19167.1 glycosyltransferase family 25 protein [Mesorhizobium sp. B2-1-8]